MVIKRTPGEKAFDWFNVVLIFVLSFIFLYPMYYALCASFSTPLQLMRTSGFIFTPQGFTTDGYKVILHNPNIRTGYLNTLFIIVVGTSVNMLLTIMGAYVLSRRNLYFKKAMNLLLVFTMYFGGGMIPTYLVVKGVGLLNSRWALILPGAIGTWNLIVMKTSFQRVPASLEESARLDGANDWVVLFRIIVPVAKATIAVMVLFYVVGHWNAWFGASIYLRDRTKYPLQLVVREIVINQQQQDVSELGGADEATGSMLLQEIIRYCAIIVSTVPILCIYPFVQRYFVTGIMMGSIKE